MTRVMSVFGDVASPVRGAFWFGRLCLGCSLCSLFRRFIRALLKLRGLWRFCLLLRLVCMGLAIVFLRDCLVLIRSRRVGRFRLGCIILARGSVMRDFDFSVVFGHSLPKTGDKPRSNIYLVLLIVSLLSAGVYGLARIPAVNHLPVLDKIGFCQRISFFLIICRLLFLELIGLENPRLFKNLGFLFAKFDKLLEIFLFC